MAAAAIAERNPLTALYPLIRARMRALIPTGWPDLAREIEGHITQIDLPPTVLLAVAACAAAGGVPRHAVSAAAATGFLLLSTRWLDDAADQDRPDGLWATVGVSRCSLFGATTLALAFQAVTSDPDTPREAADALARHMIALARGQDYDLTGTARTLDEYWAVMRGKTGAGFALGGSIGAICARTDAGTARRLEDFAMHFGVILQILDDIDGSFRPAGISDLDQGKVTLPVVYALSVDHSGRGELEDIVARGELAQNADRAREILEAAGARQYATWAAIEERKRAVENLERLPRPRSETMRAGREALQSYLDIAFSGLPELA